MTSTTASANGVFDSENDFSVRKAFRSPRRLRTEVLAGLVVALALIPEAISFSIIAGVDPRVGLFASFTMAVTISIVGGRPAMISAATGAVALVVAPLVRERGLDYLVAAVILAGVLQIALSLLGLAKLMRFVPRSVMVGFVNARHLDLHLPVAAPDRRSVAGLPAGRRGHRDHGVPASAHHGRAGTADRHCRVDHRRGGIPDCGSHRRCRRCTARQPAGRFSFPTCHSASTRSRSLRRTG